MPTRSGAEQGTMDAYYVTAARGATSRLLVLERADSHAFFAAGRARDMRRLSATRRMLEAGCGRR